MNPTDRPLARAPKRAFTAAEDAAIRDTLARHESLGPLAHRLGRHEAALWHRAKLRGLAPAEPNPRRARLFTPADDPLIVAMSRLGLMPEAIGRALGRDRDVVAVRRDRLLAEVVPSGPPVQRCRWCGCPDGAP